MTLRAWWAALALTGCALHVQVPDPDLPLREGPSPAPEVSHFAALARLPLPLVAKVVEETAVPAVEHRSEGSVVSWSFRIAREGPVVAREVNGGLCFLVPFAGAVKLSAVGTDLRQPLAADVMVCAQPRLSSAGLLTLPDPKVRIDLGRTQLPMMLKPVYAILGEKLEQEAGRALADQIRQSQWSISDRITPTTAALFKPLPLRPATCLQLRPLSLRVGQPVIDPNTLRLALSVATQPTVEEPCGPGQPAQKLPLAVDDALTHPATTLQLPIAVQLTTVEKQVLDHARGMGRIPLGKKGGPDRGWVEVTGLKLQSARGALVARATVRGEVRDSLLWIPFTRPLDGEFVLWGIPQVTATDIVLDKVQVNFGTDDRLLELGAAIERNRLADALADKLKLPTAQIEGEAKQALGKLSEGITIAGEHVPVRVDTHELKVASVRAQGQRLEVLVKFKGYVVVGDTARQ
jgi:hypothetical protein